MKIQCCNNTELVIKALNEKDYQLAILVAERLSNDHGMIIAGNYAFTHTVHLLNNTWQGEVKAADIKAHYKEAKEAIFPCSKPLETYGSYNRYAFGWFCKTCGDKIESPSKDGCVCMFCISDKMKDW